MSLWTRRRSLQLAVPGLIIIVLMLVGVLTVYADSADGSLSTGVDLAQEQTTTPESDGTPTSENGAQPAVMQSTETATPTATAEPTAVPATATPTSPPSPVNVIVNGGFEEGFLEGQGVGAGWGRFSGGTARAGWYDDTWFKVVYEGEHAQLMELKNAEDPNTYVGIFQTVSVVPHADYTLTLHGLVRSDEGSPEVSNFGYRMHYAIDPNGGTDWQSGDLNWVELPWDDQPREDPTGANEYRMESYTANVRTESDTLTLFIRGLKKWPDLNEGNYDIDGVSLVGPSVGGGGDTPTPAPTPADATTTPSPEMPETGDTFAFLENRVAVVASAALLVVLAAGALWGISRRRA